MRFVLLLLVASQALGQSDNIFQESPEKQKKIVTKIITDEPDSKEYFIKFIKEFGFTRSLNSTEEIANAFALRAQEFKKNAVEKPDGLKQVINVLKTKLNQTVETADEVLLLLLKLRLKKLWNGPTDNKSTGIRRIRIRSINSNRSIATKRIQIS